jgi:hypothetical protein
MLLADSEVVKRSWSFRYMVEYYQSEMPLVLFVESFSEPFSPLLF